MYHSTGVFSLVFTFSVHWRSAYCAFYFVIWTNGFPFPSFESDHPLIVQGFSILIILCMASCWAAFSSVRIACINLFTAEWKASAPHFSLIVSSSGSSGAPDNGRIIWYLQSQSEWNCGIAVSWSLNPIVALIAIHQPTQFFVLYHCDISNIPKPHVQCESWPLLDGFTLDVKVSYETMWIFHQFSSFSIPVFRSLWVRFTLSASNKFTCLILIPYVF